MRISYPPPLLPGARIAVTAPSSGVEASMHTRLDLVLAHLRGSGFVVEEGYCLREQRAGASACAAERAAEGVVLYLENAEQPPVALVRALHRLRWAGWFDGLTGLLVGRSAALAPAGPASLSYLDALRNTLGALPCPVLVDVDIGHRPPQFVLVNGATAEVHWSEAAGGSIDQHLG